MPTIPAALPVSGAEWSMPIIESPSASPPAESTAGETSGFGAALSSALGGLTRTQEGAAGAARALASGTATDPTAVVMAVERAQLTMQLASQIRNKAVESAQEIFRTQV